jgi:ATP-dependent helicase/nuclease subunit A
VPTLLKKVIQKKLQVENLGEELRVLYVAMTRAKEKLILTGFLKSRDEMKRKDFSFFELLSAKSYLDWVLPAMMNQMENVPQCEQASHEMIKQDMKISVIAKEQLLQEELKEQLFRSMDEKELNTIHSEDNNEPGIREEIRTIFNYHYPYAKEAGLKVKMTVSELKKLGQFQDEELSVNLQQYQDKEAPRTENQPAKITVPAFVQKAETETSGTDRGTLYHRVLELIDLTMIHSKEELTTELQRLINQGMLLQEDINKLKLDNIYAFTSSQVAERMRNAQNSGRLYKEQQFVIGIPAKEVMMETDSEELILIQGIIDVFFEEEGELVLLDYKSDLVTDKAGLIKRYKVQLQYYKRALEQMRSQRVKEMIIYSLPLAKEIRIEG